MKKIRMFTASWCPHCVRAKEWLELLQKEREDYRGLEIEMIDIDTQQEKLTDVDFYYVPTFYVDAEKAFEGVPSEEAIRGVLDSAL